jgi:hypothetical protein
MHPVGHKMTTMDIMSWGRLSCTSAEYRVVSRPGATDGALPKFDHRNLRTAARFSYVCETRKIQSISVTVSMNAASQNRFQFAILRSRVTSACHSRNQGWQAGVFPECFFCFYFKNHLVLGGGGFYSRAKKVFFQRVRT